MKNKIDVVVDTNVFIKAIFHRDASSKQLFQLKSNENIRFVMNKDMQNELLVTFFTLMTKLLNKKDLPNASALAMLLSASLWQVKEIDHTSHTNHCEDKDDDKFIDCAIDGNVKYIITYDDHLLSLSDFLDINYRISVLNPYQFCQKYNKSELC